MDGQTDGEKKDARIFCLTDARTNGRSDGRTDRRKDERQMNG